MNAHLPDPGRRRRARQRRVLAAAAFLCGCGVAAVILAAPRAGIAILCVAAFLITGVVAAQSAALAALQEPRR